MKPKCKICEGNYILRNGSNGYFGGCSNYPKCKSTINFDVLIFEYFKANGVNVYCWMHDCFKCRQSTPVYSYFLFYELQKLDDLFGNYHGLGLGDVTYLDNLISKDVATLKKGNGVRLVIVTTSVVF